MNGQLKHNQLSCLVTTTIFKGVVVRRILLKYIFLLTSQDPKAVDFDSIKSL